MPDLIAAGRHLRLVSSNGWEYAERVNASAVVGIVAVTAERRLVLVEQFRPAIGCRGIELPAGLVGDIAGEEDEDLLVAARRELIEETGYDAEHLECLAAGNTSAGLTSEEMTFVLATGLRRISAGGGDEHEDITVHEVPVAEIDSFLNQRVTAGCKVAATLFAGLYLGRKALA